MSYLKFDKNIMTNLSQSLPKEMLRTNRSGAYHCTTIVDCNTRKQHGLLVIPIPEMDDDNHVLLSSFDETVIQHGAPFNLGLHKYQGDCFSPNGHKYIREFTCETVPKTTYRVGESFSVKRKSLYRMRTAFLYDIHCSKPIPIRHCNFALSLRSAMPIPCVWPTVCSMAITMLWKTV